MPTVTVVTNVDLAKADAVKLVGAVTDCLYPIVGCPAGYVHVHVLAGQPVSFGGGDCVTPCCQTRIVMAGDCSRELRSEMAAKLQPVLDAALQGLNSAKTQILFEKTSPEYIAIGAVLLQ
mmetsp:Transcript_76618/g.112240  ORF Transcript_76618/g.112240 Transcript_76618/m.112240 type:complete len:120 (+) Transcript_76618:60-419(+)